MASHFAPFVFIAFYTSFHLLEICEAVTMDIQPNEVSEKAQEDIHMSCRSGSLKDKAREIIFMQLGRKGDIPLAEIRLKNSAPNVRKTNSSNANYEVEGHLDTDVSLSNLNVSLLKPTSEWSGIYLCTVYYVDLTTGILLDDAAEASLTFIKKETTNESLLKKRVLFLENKVKELEDTNEKEKTDRMADKTSISLLFKKLDILEKRDREHSSEIKLMTNKESVIEKDLEKTKENLSQEVRNRLSDKKSTNSIISKMHDFEQHKEDHLNHMKLLESKMSKNERALKNTNTRLSQEVTNWQNDKATITLHSNKITALERRNKDQANKIKSLVENVATVLKRLSSVDDKYRIHSQNIKDVSDRFTKSVTPALNQLKSLKTSDTRMSSQIKGLVNKVSAMENAVSELNKKHVTPKPRRCVKKFLSVCAKWVN